MIKYLRYIAILLIKPIGKIIGVIYTPLVAIHFRKFAHNTVFNYAIKNNIHLPRLKEMNIGHIDTYSFNGVDTMGYYIPSTNRTPEGGFIEWNYVSPIKYYLTLWFIWVWIDADNTSDVTAFGYGEDILNGKHFKNFPKWFHNRIAKEQETIRKSQVGNYLELGDKREKVKAPLLMFLWNLRNSFYGFTYMFEEIEENNKYNFYHGFYLFNKYFHFGYIPYSNSKRKGRLVWPLEDEKYIDNFIKESFK